jgi:hypothetical protein
VYNESEIIEQQDDRFAGAMNGSSGSREDRAVQRLWHVRAVFPDHFAYMTAKLKQAHTYPHTAPTSSRSAGHAPQEKSSETQA